MISFRVYDFVSELHVKWALLRSKPSLVQQDKEQHLKAEVGDMMSKKFYHHELSQIPFLSINDWKTTRPIFLIS